MSSLSLKRHPLARPSSSGPDVSASPAADGFLKPAPDAPRFPARWLLLACLLVVGACFAQAPGHILADTKLDLYVDPGRFLARSLNLWDANAAFGQVQNQAVGYLFPMGSYFDAAQKVGIPMWVAQRIWLALLVSLGIWGTARVAAALRIGSPSGWVLAGLIYGLAPWIVGQLASTSAGVIPAALAPWTLLPLINATRTGSARRAAGRSGLAVFAMGGVNATSVLGVLVLPALYLLSRRRSPARRTLTFWWIAAVSMACLWWAVALVFQGKWGLDFVPYTETTTTTQSTTSALEVLRGTPDWLSYLHLGYPWVPAGWSLATTPIAVLATTAVAAVGLTGLSRRGLPERWFLIGAFAFGMVCVGAGYSGDAGGLGGHLVRSLLTGPLAAFRNTDKFEPMITLPLALGTAHLLGTVRVPRWRAAAATGVLGIVLVTCLPFWQGRLAAAGTFKSVPSYWYKLADFMRAHATDSTTLLEPTSAFAMYDWGRPMDEPLEPLSTTSWAVRNLLPLGGLASTQLLDSIETEIDTSEISPHLDEVLSRAGVSYVVARNDLDWQLTDSPPPAQVIAALKAGGLTEVASFGPMVASDAGEALLALPRSQTRVHALEVFAVKGGASLVHTYPQAGTVALSGGPQSLLQLADRDQLSGHAVVLAASLPRNGLTASDTWVVSDASRRESQDFGLPDSQYSYTLQPNERAPANHSLKIVPPLRGALQAVARYRGNIASVHASSYGSWLLQIPELAPSNVFDGIATTAWVPGTVSTSVGQWVQANLTAPVSVSHIRVQLLEDGPWRPRVHRLTITTQQGSVTRSVTPNQSIQTLATVPGRTNFVRITFAAVSGEVRGGATAGLRDVFIPGVSATRYIEPPEEPSLLAQSRDLGITPSFDFTRQIADQADLLRRDPEVQLARVIKLPAAASLRISGTVLPTPGARLDQLLDASHGLSIRASSSWDNLPRYRPANAVDGNPRTMWIAAPPTVQPANNPPAAGVNGPATPNQRQTISPVPSADDPDPTLYLSWRRARTIASVAVVPPHGFAVAPTVLRISSRDGTRTVKVAPDARLAHFPALRTDRLTITFPGVVRRYTRSADGTRVQLPLGVGDLDFPALRSLYDTAPAPGEEPTVGCGQGPDLRIDGRTYETRVTAHVASIDAQSELPFSLCTSGHTVSLSGGTHWIFSPGTGAFTITQMTMAPSSPTITVDGTARSVRILHWAADSRELHLGAGPATYLALRQNANAGWQATMDGRRLTPITLDGWEQGYAVPAGSAGTVKLVYAPNHAFQLALIVGAGLVALLIIVTLLPARRRWKHSELVTAPAAPAGRRAAVVTVGVAVIAVALVSWSALIAVVAIGAVARWRPALLSTFSGLALMVAGIIVAVHVVPIPTEHLASFGPVVETLAGVAFAAALISQVWPAGQDPRREP